MTLETCYQLWLRTVVGASDWLEGIAEWQMEGYYDTPEAAQQVAEKLQRSNRAIRQVKILKVGIWSPNIPSIS